MVSSLEGNPAVLAGIPVTEIAEVSASFSDEEKKAYEETKKRAKYLIPLDQMGDIDPSLFNKGTDAQKVAAWKLMVFLSQQANGYFTSQTGYYPTCSYSYNSDDYQSYLESELTTATQELELASAVVNNETYNGEGKGWTKFVDPGFRGSADIREAVELIPGYLLTGTPYATVPAALDAVYNSLSDYHKQ